MTSARVKVLTNAVGAVLGPSLREAGFVYDRRDRVFRLRCGEITRIVSFQVGVRSLAGCFTVNLGVYHPVFREDVASAPPVRPNHYHCLVQVRLGDLRDTFATALFRRLLSDRDGALAWWLTTSMDKWWRFSEDEVKVEATLLSIAPLLLDRGLSWLQEHATLEVLADAASKLRNPRGRS